MVRFKNIYCVSIKFTVCHCLSTVVDTYAKLFSRQNTYIQLNIFVLYVFGIIGFIFINKL